MLIDACECARLWRTKDQTVCFTVPFFADLVVIAGSLYPIPSRTRPSKSPAPMVLSLKAWKSRSLPGLQRTERFTISSRQVRPKKPSRETAGAFCLFGTLAVIVRQRDPREVARSDDGLRRTTQSPPDRFSCGILAGWTPLASSACSLLRRCWFATPWRAAAIGSFWRSPEHALWAPFMASCKAHGRSDCRGDLGIRCRLSLVARSTRLKPKEKPRAKPRGFLFYRAATPVPEPRFCFVLRFTRSGNSQPG